MSLRYKDNIIAGRAAQIYSGTEAPDDTIGQNGDIYVKYSES